MNNPFVRNMKRLDTYLSQLLWALAKKNGGELRISGYDAAEVPNRCAIFTEWDNITHELIIKAADVSSEMILINTEQQWATTQRQDQPEQPQIAPTRQPQQPQRSALLNDADLARIEENLLRRAAERQEQQRADQTNNLMREM